MTSVYQLVVPSLVVKDRRVHHKKKSFEQRERFEGSKVSGRRQSIDRSPIEGRRGGVERNEIHLEREREKRGISVRSCEKFSTTPACFSSSLHLRFPCPSPLSAFNRLPSPPESLRTKRSVLDFPSTFASERGPHTESAAAVLHSRFLDILPPQ